MGQIYVIFFSAALSSLSCYELLSCEVTFSPESSAGYGTANFFEHRICFSISRVKPITLYPHVRESEAYSSKLAENI